MIEQIIVFGVLLLALILFIWGKWRYDVVALLALLAVAVTGIIPADQAFAGFGHPAVITVAAVLVVSRGLLNSGVVDEIARRLSLVGDGPAVQVATVTTLVTVFSGFMNNVGALALMMPVTIRMARRNGHSPSLFLMPLAFGSLLGGLTTLIGTPPNIIIATYRADHGLEPFRMFDFTPVGLGVALAGLLFIIFIGWRLVPVREGQASRQQMFEIGNYVTEVRVTETSDLIGRSLRDIHSTRDMEVVVVGLVRGDQHIAAPSSFEILEAGDILIVEASSRDLALFINSMDLQLAGTRKPLSERLQSRAVSIVEAVVRPNSPLVGATVRSLDLRWQFGMNLLAVSRQGERLNERLSQVRFQPGDVLLLQGPKGTMPEVLSSLEALPLAKRGLSLGRPRRIVLSLGIFGAALGTAALGLVPVQVAFIAAAVAMLMTNLLTLSEAYESIDWPVIVLLGGMIPVGQALELTGGADLIANAVLTVAQGMAPWATLAIVLVGTMFLSDLVNNAAAAILMAPIAITIAEGLGASPDPFLISVAIGASCAFLTPIGHQSNTLVMGPGGYHFGDYWRMGLFLEIIIVLVAIPLILHFWPLALAGS
ncbi:MAG TPA: SLC13 family permease [Candidatus Sulfomarinibacteraceae bacterium]|nr:SLC13 family permease [Candidatus Sulfomarinibacteraceae bacterium]